MASVMASQPEASLRRLSSRDGLALAVETRGSADGPGILFAHGFGQTRHAWSASAEWLAAGGYCCTTYDARGHGDSDWRGDVPYTWDQMGDDLRAIVATLPSLPVLIGASMGGLVGLAAEAAHSPLFRALVLVDVTPRWEPRGVDRILNFMRAHPYGFKSLEDAAEAIAAYLPHRAERKSPERLRSLLADHGDGRLRWHWDPRLLDELAHGSESQQPLLIEAARRLSIPVLLISGGASDIVSPATIDEFLALVPHAEHVVVPRATHMVAGDDNIVFTRHVVQFLGALQDKESVS
jgi:pimeloyl-ACP methyl ester carboxylesterase